MGKVINTEMVGKIISILSVIDLALIDDGFFDDYFDDYFD